MKNFLIVALVVVVAALAFWFFFPGATDINPQTNTSGGAISEKASGYQAVFLVNGQVYFGKLANQNSQFPTLTDIYYLQVQQVLQPVSDDGGEADPVNDVSLIKLGGELHGPTDRMEINRDQILLIETLKSDSNVVRAIEEYVASQAGSAAPVAPANATQ